MIFRRKLCGSLGRLTVTGHHEHNETQDQNTIKPMSLGSLVPQAQLHASLEPNTVAPQRGDISTTSR